MFGLGEGAPYVLRRGGVAQEVRSGESGVDGAVGVECFEKFS
jgi:hypothetical protein